MLFCDCSSFYNFLVNNNIFNVLTFIILKRLSTKSTSKTSSHRLFMILSNINCTVSIPLVEFPFCQKSCELFPIPDTEVFRVDLTMIGTPMLHVRFQRPIIAKVHNEDFSVSPRVSQTIPRELADIIRRKQFNLRAEDDNFAVLIESICMCGCKGRELLPWIPADRDLPCTHRRSGSNPSLLPTLNESSTATTTNAV